jgi:hypothetical protein
MSLRCLNFASVVYNLLDDGIYSVNELEGDESCNANTQMSPITYSLESALLTAFAPQREVTTFGSPCHKLHTGSYTRTCQRRNRLKTHAALYI